MNTDWRDIETAPKDGTYVLVFDGNVFIAAHGDYGWCPMYGEEFGIELAPTHWIPLPDAPHTRG